MIYTITLNPSIDYVITLNDLRKNCVNIVNTNNIYVGGKGINVSKVLKEHGIKSTTLGFISGFTGDFIKSVLGNDFIKTEFVNVKNNFSRINIKMKVQEEETEINGLGPKISEDDINELYKKINNISSGDILIIAGSIPKTLGDNFYEKIIERLKDKNIKIIVDARNKLLLNVLKYKPFLIKPNHHEISEIFNMTKPDKTTLIDCGKKLQEMGARNVLISMGSEGAVLISEEDEIYTSNTPNGVLKNSVGSGDSMVAGFISGYMKTNNYEEALRHGAASGSATAFSEDLAKIDLINSLLNEIEIIKL